MIIRRLLSSVHQKSNTVLTLKWWWHFVTRAAWFLSVGLHAYAKRFLQDTCLRAGEVRPWGLPLRTWSNPSTLKPRPQNTADYGLKAQTQEDEQKRLKAWPWAQPPPEDPLNILTPTLSWHEPERWKNPCVRTGVISRSLFTYSRVNVDKWEIISFLFISHDTMRALNTFSKKVFTVILVAVFKLWNVSVRIF